MGFHAIPCNSVGSSHNLISLSTDREIILILWRDTMLALLTDNERDVLSAATVAVTQKSLISTTEMSSSFVSRVCTKMVRMGLLQVLLGGTDNSRKRYLITANGEDALREGSYHDNSENMESLPVSEQLAKDVATLSETTNVMVEVLIEYRTMLKKYEKLEKRLDFLSQAISTGLIDTSISTTPVATRRTPKEKKERKPAPMPAEKRFAGHKDSIWDPSDPRWRELSLEDKTQAVGDWLSYCLKSINDCHKYLTYITVTGETRLNVITKEDSTLGAVFNGVYTVLQVDESPAQRLARLKSNHPYANQFSIKVSND